MWLKCSLCSKNCFITLLSAIFFELPITRTFFDFPWRFELSGVDCTYTCQLSRLRVENFYLTPAHACGPISHAWLKNMSCCHLAWHNFQKYVNPDPCKERKPCVKWINDNTFLTISDFVDKRFLDNFAFGRLRTSLEDFGLLRESSEMIVLSSKIPALPE